jgi:hypothetical protein
MAAGLPGYPRFGLAPAYRAYNRRYSADYLAAAESFSPLLAGLELNRPGNRQAGNQLTAPLFPLVLSVQFNKHDIQRNR